MAGFRLPSALCVVTNALPIDVGTSVRASTPPPALVGRNVQGPGLSDSERALIGEYAGKNINGTPFTLAALKASHHRHVLLYEQAVREFGVQSRAALFERATVECLAELIGEAQSPYGAAKEELGRHLTHVQKGTGRVTDKQLSAAIAKVLGGEKERQLRGYPDSTGQDAMRLVAKAAQVISKRRKAELEKLIESAKRPASQVTEKQLKSAVTAVLASERQKQLMGVPDDDPDGLGTNSLVAEVLEIVHDRRTEALRRLIESAKHSGSHVTRKQLSDAVAKVLGSERQKELLGVGDDATSGGGTMELVNQALAVSHDRDKAELKNLVKNAKRPESTVTRKQLSDALGRLLGDERQRQLLGAEDDPGAQELWDLMAEASKVIGKRKGGPAKGVAKPRPAWKCRQFM